MSNYRALAEQLGDLVESKQRQYGNSAGNSGDIMRVLYPIGIHPKQYRDALLVVRVLDKLNRIAQRGPDGRDLGGESPWRDIAGYGLLGLAADEKQESAPPQKTPRPPARCHVCNQETERFCRECGRFACEGCSDKHKNGLCGGPLQPGELIMVPISAFSKTGLCSCPSCRSQRS